MKNRIRTGLVLGLLLLSCVLISPADGQEVIKVGVLPFTVYAADRQKLLDWPQRLPGILAAELGKDERIVIAEEKEIEAAWAQFRPAEIDESLGREIGQKVDADYMLLGSITQINGGISLDVRILDVLQKGVLASAFAMGKREEGLEPIIQKLGKEVNLRVLRKETIAKILIEGNQAIEDGAIRPQIKMKEGDIFSPRALRDDLKSIYQLGYFLDVRAEKRDWERGKAVAFVVEEKPVIREIKFVGNQALKASELQEVVTLKTRSVLNLNLVKENVNKIIQKYREDAYFLAQVDYELESPRKGDVIVLFKITENKKIRIQTITFTGNLHFPDAQLKGLLPETKEGGFFSWLTKSGTYKEEILEKELDALLIFYLQRGFMNAKVGKPLVTFEKDGIVVNIPIEEGLQFKVGKVELLGDLIASKEELLKKVPLFTGEILNRDHIRDSVTNLSDLYADQGYAFVDVDPQTGVQPEKQTVDISFEIRKGSLVYFERVNIRGNTKTRDRVIRRQLPAVEGDLYSLSAIRTSRERLQRLGYFKEVDFGTKKGSGDDKMDLNIQVEEGPTGNFSIGGGYSSVDKLMAMVRVSQNNLFGRGQRLSASAQLGSISQLYVLSFVEPWLFDYPLSVGGDLYRIEREYTDYTVKRNGGAVPVSFPLFEEVRGFTTYKYEKVDTSNIQPNASLIIKDQEGTSTTSAVIGAIRRDSRNHYMDPTGGSDNLISLEYAGGPLGGSNFFTKYGASSAWFFTPGWKLTFMARGRIGYIQGRDGHSIPLYERYRLGGIYSVRGFESYSIGAKAPNGEVIGGDKELLFNFEMLFPLVKEIGMKGVLFFDAGNAWDVGQPYKLDDLRTGAGFGVRWLSPVGPLRIEWGYNIDPKPGEKRSAWEFAIGTFY